MNREQWLSEAVGQIETLFPRFVPDVHVSCGWPSRGGTSLKKRVLGECWKPTVSEDGVSHIFINPMISDTIQVLGILAHEMIHALHPDAGHKGEFISTAKSIGLLGPWTSTQIGPELHAHLTNISSEIGDYPHSKLTPSVERKVQTTRMKKLECPACGYVVRATQKWIDVGLPTCCCGTGMEFVDA